VRVQELGLRGASDADILARAIAEDRITVPAMPMISGNLPPGRPRIRDQLKMGPAARSDPIR
jgi:hypothetical protein